MVLGFRHGSHLRPWRCDHACVGFHYQLKVGEKLVCFTTFHICLYLVSKMIDMVVSCLLHCGALLDCFELFLRVFEVVLETCPGFILWCELFPISKITFKVLHVSDDGQTNVENLVNGVGSLC